MDKKYCHEKVEKSNYDFWKKNNFFLKSSKEIFSIVMPPPNVTGKLHLGHAWDGALQDFLIRFNHLKNKQALLYPGKDHAGIATQVLVEKSLFETKKQLREDFTRENFVKEIKKFVSLSKKNIDQQWAKLGLQLSYNFEKFTLDDDVNQLVLETFIDFYKKGWIYQDLKLVNWDTKLKTAISDIEVNHIEIDGKLYFVEYKIKDSSDKLLVATTRPETMFADVCLFLNPKDERAKYLKDKSVINPANNKVIPILLDSFVDVNFGTGVLKCTPGHSFDDYDLGKKHKLPIVSCMNKDGTINELGHKYQGKDRLVVRELLLEEFRKLKILKKTINHKINIGHSQRTQSIVEPFLTTQWFLSYDQKIINQVKKMIGSDIKIYPKRFEKEFILWMDNLKEWCISRQLWWGHQIPVWYYKEQVKVQIKSPGPNWKQDEDVLDTWFSSSLWPMVYTNKLPTSIMITGYDLIFFWVSKMILMTVAIKKTAPFSNVLLHGMFRDAKGRKMSKSYGNGIDPMEVIKTRGSDTLRFFTLFNTTPGLDLNYSNQKLDDAWNFINKIWNSARFIEINCKKISPLKISQIKPSPLDLFILKKIFNLKNKIEENIKEYNISYASKEIYNFFYDDFCGFYLELIKKDLKKDSSKINLLTIFLEVLKLLHPFLPFVTEEIYKSFTKESILKSKFEKINFKSSNTFLFETLKDVIHIIRNFKTTNKILEKINISISHKEITSLIEKYFSKEINIANEGKLLFSSLLFDGVKLDIYFDQKIDLKQVQNQKDKILREIERAKGMLQNKGFLKNAPQYLIEKEQKKLEKHHKELKNIKKLMSQYEK